jgi:hypothetical protein
MNAGGFLPFWAANMLHVRDKGLDWFGFRYSADEWARFEALAAPVSEGRYRAFLFVNALLFIVVAAALIGLVMVPVLTLLSPDPAQLPATAFFGVLGTIILVCFAIVLPTTMALAARLVAATGAPAPAEAGDDALAALVRWQILRMGLFVTAIAFALIGLSIGFGIDLEPWIALTVRIFSFGLSACTLILIFSRRRAS